MNNAQVIIDTLEELLAKPDLSKTQRKIFEVRLGYWRDRRKPGRDTAVAVKKSTAVRHMAARRKYRVIRPMIIRMQAEGLTGKEVVAALKEAGITNLRGKPYGLSGIRYIMRQAQ